MSFKRNRLSAAASVAVLTMAISACSHAASLDPAAGFGPNPTLPAPEKSLLPTMNIAPAKGWVDGAMPVAAQGLKVQPFAKDLQHPRWVYVLPNGDVLVAETDAPPKPEDSKGIKGWAAKKVMQKAGSGLGSANQITLLRDTNGDGIAETRHVFLKGLNSPFGMALVGTDLYVANTDAVMRFPYQAGATEITTAGTKLVDLPGGPLNHHWTKGLLASRDGTKLYASVGSNSNIVENGFDKEKDRAAIWEIDRATGQSHVFAGGLRNPIGMGWNPANGALWAVVNERDELGNDLVPDYMTSVKDGGFYGWPYSYYGQTIDERIDEKDRRPDLVAKAIKPDYALGAHTASLGLAFNTGNLFPAQYKDGVFIGQHGSWNRKPRSGYKVIFVPFKDGMPNGAPQDILTGFLDQDGDAQGRPVGVAIDAKGGLLVADDVGSTVWRVVPQAAQ